MERGHGAPDLEQAADGLPRVEAPVRRRRHAGAARSGGAGGGGGPRGLPHRDDPAAAAITLSVNGKVRQTGDLGDQIWSVREAIAYLSGFVTLRAGDLIMTGTPAGVSAVVRGDVLEGSIAGVGTVKTTIV